MPKPPLLLPGKTYLVGGAVRDKLLGVPPKEQDWVVVGATPEEMLALNFNPVGKDFPVFLHPDTHEEYALARTERKTGSGYRGFECYAAPDVTLEQDLLRRDLTINAMAMNEDGTIIDPHGGEKDLKNRVLRHVSQAFVEDPVRLLRVARFQARFASFEFSIANETLALMQNMVNNGEVDALVPERVWQEINAALCSHRPRYFIEALRQSGALQRLLPEIDNLFGVPQTEKWHPEIDTGIHTLMVLDAATKLSTDPIIRFAALTHDIGKGTTAKNILPSHHGHEARSVKLLNNLYQRYPIPKDFQSLANIVAKYHGLCHTVFELTAKTILKMLESIDAFRRPQRLHDFLISCEADHLGRKNWEGKPYPQKAFLQACYDTAAAISTDKLIAQGLKGAAIGDALRKQRIAAIQQVNKPLSSDA